MCLFNPQLDIYTFQKHFRWKDPVILTFPPSLHRYHENGFPALLAFKNGRQVLKEFYNYARFDTLKTILWNDSIRMHPTGQLHDEDKGQASKFGFFGRVKVNFVQTPSSLLTQILPL
jgi:hypothetical protein